MRANDILPQVPDGKIRVCVAGFAISHNVGRAASVARAVVAHAPDKYESWFYFDDQGLCASDHKPRHPAVA